MREIPFLRSGCAHRDRLAFFVLGFEDAHHRFADVNDTGQLAVGRASNQKRDGATSADSFQVSLVFLVTARRKYPRLMQGFAAQAGSDKFIFAFWVGFGEENER